MRLPLAFAFALLSLPAYAQASLPTTADCAFENKSPFPPDKWTFSAISGDGGTATIASTTGPGEARVFVSGESVNFLQLFPGGGGRLITAILQEGLTEAPAFMVSTTPISKDAVTAMGLAGTCTMTF